MPIQWVDQWGNGTYTTLPRLIKAYIDKENPSHAVDGILRLSELLILSNNLVEAHLIASAVYRLVKAFNFTDEGDRLDGAYTPITLEIFWTVNQSTFPRPRTALPSHPKNPEAWKSKQQWDKYRECTRTGWMLQHVGLAEPENPSSIWRETEDPAMLAMCVRLLAKTTVPCTYPPDTLAREALEAAQKLYSKPDTPTNECGWEPDKPKRQSYLLYRRLVVELAIRLGEFQTAADILGQGLRQDLFTSGGDLESFLMVPGIYDVLPLLARGGKESNPFFIPKEDAVVMAKEITAALELRAEHGRQWALHPSKVGWRELLDRLAEGVWKAHPKECRDMGVENAMDLLYEPATEEEIAAAEEKVGELPTDFKEMVRVANGFMGGWHFFAGGIAGIQSISIDDGCGESGYMYYEDVMEDIEYKMIRLMPGTECDGFDHFILPPRYWEEAMVRAGKEVKDGEYQYWNWTYWSGSGISHWDSVRDFVCSCVEEVEEMIETGQEEDWESSTDL
ncbi:hypothetical protein N7491_000533 [Penicillium cf. griseofulvum]|uniref:Knr4/Smi1-like domain-containing protein n=1 Tax=Penicillium cf. griseofulvum TaxID=2972120 RepID=A0A9W9JQ98_9EURO|nr:hypothetical protein N7472_004104 [Penicillium cf. griseofulvum]KAJ5443195.1 hypothetical protein N7445_004308 [Penicillium cf. griseofulvum]KAJ5451351.1 hypothetical protein N7491_000533 [Penicillium cf. griseofulvum]